jgi:hypothetical protein
MQICLQIMLQSFGKDQALPKVEASSTLEASLQGNVSLRNELLPSRIQPQVLSYLAISSSKALL